MVGRPPPPPPPPRSVGMLVAIGVAAVAAIVGGIFFFRSPVSAPVTQASMASSSSSTSPKPSMPRREYVVIGTDAITGKEVTTLVEAPSEEAFQARVAEIRADAERFRAQGLILVALPDGGGTWMAPADAVRMATMNSIVERTAAANEVLRQAANQRIADEFAGWVAKQAAEKRAADLAYAKTEAIVAAQQAEQDAGNRAIEAHIKRLEDEQQALLAQLSPKDRDAAMVFLMVEMNARTVTAKGDVISREAKIAKASAGIPQIGQIVQLIDQVQELRNAQHGVSSAVLTPEQELAAERQRVIVYDAKGNPLPGYGTKPVGLVFNIVEGTGEVRRIDSNDKDALFTGPGAAAASATPAYNGPGVVQANGDVVIHQGKKTDVVRPSRPPLIPDPIGLGERLVLIDILVEKFGQRRADLVNPTWTYADLVELYWVQVRQSGRPAPYPEAPAAQTDATPANAGTK